MQKTPLLFLCHRIPYPPNKGDKIRSFNMLKALSEHFTIYLASFVDDSFDWQYSDALDKYCHEKLLVGQNKLFCKLKSAKGLLNGSALSLPYYGSRQVQAWVDTKIAQHGIEKAFVFSSTMAQFVMGKQHQTLQTVVDFVDVDSDKWRQYAQGKSGLARWIYSREYEKLQTFENKVARQASHALFVSPQEADLFRQQLPKELHGRVSGMLNGVDTVFFDPEVDANQSLPTRINVVFTGAMDYWANVDAVLWFVNNVWDAVRERLPQASFYVVGGNPDARIQALDGKNGIAVTGRVKDVRPYIKHADVSVAPLQIARGIQNKVLEAMSLCKPVIATSMAIEGIEADTPHIVIEDEPMAFAQQTIAHIETPRHAPDNREWIMQNLQWSATLSRLPALFDGAQYAN